MHIDLLENKNIKHRLRLSTRVSEFQNDVPKSLLCKLLLKGERNTVHIRDSILHRPAVGLA